MLSLLGIASAGFHFHATRARSDVVMTLLERLDFQAADAQSLPEVASFFVDSFWLEGTTFGGGVQLRSGDRKQLIRHVSEDLSARYDLAQSPNGKPSLFWRELILARDEPGGLIVGCVGLEASLFDTITGAALQSRQAERLLRIEIDAMTSLESERAGAILRESGVGALAMHVLQRDESLLVQQWAGSHVPHALLANLAVSPSCRGRGVGRELCEFAELCCRNMGSILLQVEDANSAAQALYTRCGYAPIFRNEDATGLRLSPSKGLMKGLLPIENAALLKEVRTTLVTMAKRVESQTDTQSGTV